MKKIMVILLAGALFLQACESGDADFSNSEKTKNTTMKEEKVNDLVVHDYEGETIDVSSDTAINLEKIKADASIESLCLYNCGTKEKKDIMQFGDYLYDITPGTYRVYARYETGEIKDVTELVASDTYYQAIGDRQGISQVEVLQRGSREENYEEN